MGVDNAAAIAAALIEHGRAPDTPAVAICNGGLPGQRILRTSLSGLGTTVGAQGVQPPAVFVIGGVAAFAERT